MSISGSFQTACSQLHFGEAFPYQQLKAIVQNLMVQRAVLDETEPTYTQISARYKRTETVGSD